MIVSKPGIYSPLVAPAPAAAADAAGICTGGKERVKVGDGRPIGGVPSPATSGCFEFPATSACFLLLEPPPPPLVEWEAAAPLGEDFVVKQLTLRPRDGRRLREQDKIENGLGHRQRQVRSLSRNVTSFKIPIHVLPGYLASPCTANQLISES